MFISYAVLAFLPRQERRKGFKVSLVKFHILDKLLNNVSSVVVVFVQED